MKITLFAALLSLSSFSSFASNTNFSTSCEQAAETASEDKFRNLEYGCYGNAVLVETLNASTMHVTVDAVGGSGACGRKVYEVKYKEAGRSCRIISVTRLGMGGI